MDDYDDEPERDVGATDQGVESGSIFGNINALAYYRNNDDDPYLTLKECADGVVTDEDEREELAILPTDNFVLAARVEDEVAHLECYLYEDDADNLYVHHDIMLPAIPLCLEWLYLPTGNDGMDTHEGGNLVAVGTMDPDIELWDLDTVDSLYPHAILGAGNSPAKEHLTRKKKKSGKPQDDYHVDAVLSLAANRQHRNLLASASADQTIKLWDLTPEKCAKSYYIHSDKVCSLAWHPTESTAILSGGYDQMIIAGDMRAPETGTRKWKVGSDIEKVDWDAHDPNYFYVSTESGTLHYFDARQSSTTAKRSSSIWTLQAHSAALTTFSINPHVQGYFATGSDDKSIKLWNACDKFDSGKGPTLITSRESDVGRVFSVGFAPDETLAYRLAVAGSRGALKIWDTSSNNAVRATFGDRMPNPKTGGRDETVRNVVERIIGLDEGVDNDESDESDDSVEDDTEEADGEGMIGEGYGDDAEMAAE